jgi:membrane protein
MSFINDNGLKLSASLALLYCIFHSATANFGYLAGWFILGHDAITNSIYPQIKGYVGGDAAVQIQNMLKILSCLVKQVPPYLLVL